MRVARIGCWWISLVVCACGSGPRLEPEERALQITLSVTRNGIERSPDVVLPGDGSVAWLNALGDPEQRMSVRIHDAMEGSLPCRTTVGFAPVIGGEVIASDLAANDFASICFHGRRTYQYTVRAGERVFRGTIRVSGGGQVP